MKTIKIFFLFQIIIMCISHTGNAQGSGIPRDSMWFLRNFIQKKSLLGNRVSGIPAWRVQLQQNMSGILDPMAFNKNRPVVVVLIHGVTGFETTDPRIGTLKGARNYWGYDFVEGIFGDTRKQDQYTTFAGDGTASDYVLKNSWDTYLTDDNNPLHHFITLYGKPDIAKGFYTPVSVMLTYRDGSKDMHTQIKETASQIVSLYQRAFGNWPDDKKPQIILLCHSFGGLVARSICSYIDAIPPLPVSGNAATGRRIEIIAPNLASYFSTTDKMNFDFIRNKTLYITTLSTPHEGSPILQNAKLGILLQDQRWLKEIGLGDVRQRIDDSDPDTYIIKQLEVSFVNKLNTTILRPDKCVRRDGSLIPIHTLAGRAPGGPDLFNNTNDNDGGINGVYTDTLHPNESNRKQFESKNLVAVDYAMHLFFGPKPWGSTPIDNSGLDIIKTVEKEIITGTLRAPVYLPTGLLNPVTYYIRNQMDGEIDNDGFVPANSSLGVNLGTTVLNFFEHTNSWRSNGVNVPIGSWYRFYRSGADFHHHGTIKFNKSVSVWLHDNIFLFNQVPFIEKIGNGAGPKVALTGAISTW